MEYKNTCLFFYPVLAVKYLVYLALWPYMGGGASGARRGGGGGGGGGGGLFWLSGMMFRIFYMELK